MDHGLDLRVARRGLPSGPPPVADRLLDAARLGAVKSQDLRLLLDEELLRFVEILYEAGPVDPVAAVRLYQAEYSLEAVR